MKIFYALLCFILFSNLSFGCSCFECQTFCQGIDSTTIVSKVKVLNTSFGADFETYMDLEIIEDLNLKSTKQRLRVLASLGTTSDPFFFGTNDTLIIRHFNNNISSFEPHDFFFENGCADNFLEVKNGRVNRGTTTRPDFVSCEQFESDFKACLNLTPLDNPSILGGLPLLFPNPAYDVLNLNIDDASFFEYDIFDAFGTKIRSELQIGERARVDVQHLPHGVYFVSIRFRETRMVRKFIKS